MEYSLLKSDLNISRIGFGCMSLDPADPKAENILHMATEGGLNYFDTADLYNKGQNEIILGRAFRHKRKEVIIATKSGINGETMDRDGIGNPSKIYPVFPLIKVLKDYKQIILMYTSFAWRYH